MGYFYRIYGGAPGMMTIQRTVYIQGMGWLLLLPVLGAMGQWHWRIVTDNRRVMAVRYLCGSRL